jgi:hypothetical protein
MSAQGDFWSRRKAKVREEEEAERARIEDQARIAEMAELEEKSDEEILAELELPDPDELETGDDFAAFLRRRALRKLWLTNPALANVDGLVDYGEDFSEATGIVAELQTVYRVGKGMLKDALDPAEAEASEAPAGGQPSGEMAAQRQAEVEFRDKGAVQHNEEQDVAALTEPAGWDQTAALEDPVSAPNSTGEDTENRGEEAAILPRRRMRFSFSE